MASVSLSKHWKENGDGSLRKYYVFYLVAFGVIALIAFLSQLLIQNYLGRQSEDSYLINVAGRQRMLSQKITKNLSFYHFDNSDTIKTLVSDDFEEWKENHEKLKTGTLINSNYNTKEIKGLYLELDVFYKPMSNAVLGYLGNRNEQYYRTVLYNERNYLPVMDRIVNLYDANYQKKLQFLRQVELGLSIFLVFVLVVEMFFVFLPLINKLQVVFGNLIKAEKESSELVDNLNSANLRINRNSKELSDINLALERAVFVIRTDTEGNIIYANDGYCKLAKYSYPELHEKQLFYNNEGGSESVIYTHIKSEENKRSVWQGEVRDTAQDGTEFWLDVTLFPIVNTVGELYEYFVICSDVTKRKEAESELKLMNENRFQKQEEQQKINSRSIIQGQETERKRMAIEVHDGLGQMLTALKFTCEALDPEDSAQKDIKDHMKNLLRDVIRETRRISSDLLPTVLNDFGLVAGIKELIEVSTRSSDLEIDLNDDAEALRKKRLSIEKEIATYRITQEAVNNAMKYSQSSKLTIDLNSDVEYLTIRINDYGTGINNLDELLNVSGKNKGNGLRNMRERAKLIGASFYINSNKSTGTEIFLEIPL